MATARATRRPHSVALLPNNPFLTDSRVWKIAGTLGKAGYDVTVVARAQADLPARQEEDGFTVLRVEQPKPFPWLPTPGLPQGEEHGTAAGSGPTAPGPVDRAKRVASASAGRGAQALRYLRLTQAWASEVVRAVPWADVWQAEGLVTLPLAAELRRRRGGLAIYDSRDLDVQAGRFAKLPGPWRAMLERRETSLARSMDALTCASEPYAKVLGEAWGRKPVVVWNGPPDFTPPDPPERRWHERLGLAPETKVVLFLGLTMPGRGIAELCRAIGEVPGAVLVVAGFGTDYARYQAEAAALPHADRIFFPGGVAPADILPMIASADISAMPVQGDTLNHQLNTPTKLFDAMGAGVPVVASDLPGMGPIVRDTACGELCDPDDPADIARAIRVILDASPERRAEYRAAALAAARGPYSWDKQAATLLSVYDGLRVPA
ncbi:MAG: glycosyltransferase family 4 protein [Chloroflexota bacterium]